MLSLVVPTYNEAESLPAFLPAVTEALKGIEHEILIVDDDSPDHTWLVAEDLRVQFPAIRVIRRIGRRGLSSAVIEGCNAARGDVLAVMDADGQHDAAMLPALATAVRDGAVVAVASRYLEGGTTGEWAEHRKMLSWSGTQLAKSIVPKGITDPLSGYFAVQTAAYRSVAKSLRPVGFKILLEILAALPRSSRTAEVPLAFKPREHGASKLTARVQMQFITQFFRLFAKRWGGKIAAAAFVAICIALLALALPAYALMPIYTDATMRQKVQTAVTAYADQEGLPLSSVLIRRVWPDHVDVMQRRYRRGADATECFMLPYDLSPPHPCAN